MTYDAAAYRAALPLDGRVMADLGQQVARLREDVLRLTAHAQRGAARIAHLEAALTEVRALMTHLPAHDNVAEVAVRLRGHFDYLATTIIDDALAVPAVDVSATDASEEGRAV